jgi:hypothetical protein
MASLTTNTKKTGTITAREGAIRKDAQKDYVRKLELARKTKDPKGDQGVFVLPVFTDAGKETPTVVRAIESPTMSMVMVCSVGEMEYFPEQRMWREDVRYSLIFAPTSFLPTKYKAGNNIGGKIVRKYSVGKGNEKEVLLGIGTDIPCVTADGEVIYKKEYWTPKMDEQDDEQPEIANLEEIRQARLIAKGANNAKIK